jgi:tetratricopeptide (TPR) repeat protein
MTLKIDYQNLWCDNDEQVQRVASNPKIVTSIRAMAYFILREYENAKELIDSSSEIDPTVDPIRQELKLYFDLTEDKHKDLSEYSRRAEELLDKAPWLIYTRLLLGNIFEWEKRYEDAEEAFKRVLEFCPDNIAALAGEIRYHMHKRSFGQALSILKIDCEAALEKLNPAKRRHWQTILFAYRLFSYWGENILLRFALGFAIMFSAFLPPIFWIIPAAILLIMLSFSISLLRKDPLSFSMSLISALAVLWIWGVGILLRFLVSFIASLFMAG